ncbi:MAG TPA: cytochrome C biogenesis protein CycJ [Chloroflexi bacterium]|nr:cytochrome C biogenesis protein CycJ [Chloroflexota bacterium]
MIVASVGFLVFNAMGSSMAYFKTVGEMEASGKSTSGDQMRVGGTVLAGSIQRDVATNELRFTMTDGVNTLPVVYTGVVPDIFSEHVEVVVEGKVGSDGTMHASTLLTKCPSRFESATQTTG